MQQHFEGVRLGDKLKLELQQTAANSIAQWVKVIYFV